MARCATATWQTIAYALISPMLVYVLIGPRIVTVALAVIRGAFFEGGLEQWRRWQVGRATKKVTVSS